MKQTKEKQELLADLEQNLGTLKDKFEKLRSWWSNAATQMRCNLLRIKIDHQQHSEGGPPPNQQYSDDQTPSDENGNADLVLPIQPSDTDQGLITNLQTKVEELQELIRVLMGLQDEKIDEMQQAGGNFVQHFLLVWQRLPHIFTALGGTGIHPSQSVAADSA